MRNLLLPLMLLFPLGLDAQSLQEARVLFHKAVSDEEYLSPAREAFQGLRSKYRELSEMYIATLLALEAKHAFAPMTKLNKAQEALALMDRIVEQNPADAEIRFLRLSTTFYLPFFFKRGEETKRDASVLATLLPVDTKVPADIRNNARNFLLQNELLSNGEKALLCKSEQGCDAK